jgi:hypothetical protein
MLLIALIFGGYQFKEHYDLKTEFLDLSDKYKALSSNSKAKVQKDASKFLKSFYTYEGRAKKENIDGLATKEVQDTLFQTYEILDKDFEVPNNIEYKSEIENITIYHARDEYEKNAKVLATFDSIITINGNKSHGKAIAELELELQNEKWLITKYQLLQDVDNFEGN